MTINKRFTRGRTLAAAVLFGAGALAALSSAHAIYNPPIRMSPQGVEYMAGGIGSEEAEFMEMVAPRWAATLAFGVKGGRPADFAAEVKVLVRDTASGKPVLDVRSSGPFLVARLAPGSYTVEAALAGQAMTQPLAVREGGAARVDFVWPSMPAPSLTAGARAPS